MVYCTIFTTIYSHLLPGMMGLSLWLTKKRWNISICKTGTSTIYINGMFNSYVAVYRRVFSPPGHHEVMSALERSRQWELTISLFEEMQKCQVHADAITWCLGG
jgi:pentatricopeptide repeat protein